MRASTILHPAIGVALALALAATLLTALGSSASAALFPGGARADVAFGADDDNAANTFLQPEGVAARQHLDNTDVLLGSANRDLLVGNLGDDTIVGGSSDDVLVGGPERGQQPNSDVLLGDQGNDVSIWAPGDGSDAFVGGSGTDTQILAPFVTDAGQLVLVDDRNRVVPQVTLDGLPQFSCTVETVPSDQELAGFTHLVRFFAGGNLAVTIRMTDVEQVLCPSADAGTVNVADLGDETPVFEQRPLSDLRGTLATIAQAG